MDSTFSIMSSRGSRKWGINISNEQTVMRCGVSEMKDENIANRECASSVSSLMMTHFHHYFLPITCHHTSLSGIFPGLPSCLVYMQKHSSGAHSLLLMKYTAICYRPIPSPLSRTTYKSCWKKPVGASAIPAVCP